MENKQLKQLDAITSDDISSEVKPRRSIGASGIIRLVIFIICLCVFIYAAVSLISTVSSYSESDKYYEDIKDQFNTDDDDKLLSASQKSPSVFPLDGFDAMLKSDGKPAETAQTDEDLEKLLFIRNKLDALKSSIPELYGWIKVDNTDMDYPVVYNKDNLFYVTHGADMKYSEAGAIFVDSRCTLPTYNQKNLIVYGHNIRTMGTMFNGIVYFLDKNYFDSHKTITLYTFDGIYEYTIFSVYTTQAGGEYVRTFFTDDEDFSSFVSTAAVNSLFKRENLTLDGKSPIITLSTCSNYINNSAARYTLIGVMTSSITDK